TLTAVGCGSSSSDASDAQELRGRIGQDQVVETARTYVAAFRTPIGLPGREPWVALVETARPEPVYLVSLDGGVTTSCDVLTALVFVSARTGRIVPEAILPSVPASNLAPGTHKTSLDWYCWSDNGFGGGV